MRVETKMFLFLHSRKFLFWRNYANSAKMLVYKVFMKTFTYISVLVNLFLKKMYIYQTLSCLDCPICSGQKTPDWS
jgi:hypothetical protein